MEGFGFLLLVYGIINAFLGYKLYKLSLFFGGFLTGALLGLVIAPFFQIEEISLILILMLVSGIMLGAFAVQFWKFGVFIECFGYAFLFTVLSLLLLQADSGEMEINHLLLAGYVIGLLAGIIGIAIARIMIIVSTGISGGMIAGLGFSILTGKGLEALLPVLISALTTGGLDFKIILRLSKYFDMDAMLYSSVIIAIAGILVQFFTTKEMWQTSEAMQGTTAQGTGTAQAAGTAQETKTTQAAGNTWSINPFNLYEKLLLAVLTSKRVQAWNQKLEQKYQSLLQQRKERDEGMSVQTLLIQIEAALYRCKPLAWLLSFLEISTVGVVALFLLLGYFFWKGEEAGLLSWIANSWQMALPFVFFFCILGAVKRKRPFVLILLAITMILDGLSILLEFQFHICWLVDILYRGLRIGICYLLLSICFHTEKTPQGEKTPQ